jgi:hypothetical protein
VTGAGGRRRPGLRPLRLSLGNAPPLDVPARFIALGGVSMATGDAAGTFATLVTLLGTDIQGVINKESGTG